MKKIIFCLAIIAIMGSVNIPNSNADVSCTAASVDQVMMRPDNQSPASPYGAYLTCPGKWDSRKFWFDDSDDSKAQAGYATVLTALSLDKNVKLDVTSANWNSLIINIQIIK